MSGPARVSFAGPVDIGRLIAALVESMGPSVTVGTSGIAPGMEGDTTYEVSGVDNAVLIKALSQAHRPNLGRQVMLDAAPHLEEVLDGERLWADLPNMDQVLAAALLLLVDIARSAPLMQTVDTSKPSHTARESVALRRAEQERALGR